MNDTTNTSALKGTFEATSIKSTYMSVWRQRAIDCLPESRKDFEDPHTSIYTIFSELLSATINFHKTNSISRLQRIYDFAEWSFRQKSKDLWNAAAVAFYEHLGDYPETRHSIYW